MTIPDARRQFFILYRDFLKRIIDLEVLSARADTNKLVAQSVALLAAFNLVFLVVRVSQYTRLEIPRDKLLIAAWGDQEFLISTTMAIAGLFAVLSWNAVLPDRRDSFVLGLLPLRIPTIAAAKVAAIGTALAISLASANVFTGLSYPLLVIPPGAGLLGPLRSVCAYWLTMAAAGLFVCCGLLALQGVASQVMTHRRFQRVSGFLQLAALFLILGVYFLTPPLASVRGLTAPENQALLAWLPAFWFLGLFQQLNDANHPVFAPLAARALAGLGIAMLLAAATHILAWRRGIRRTIEQPDIAPADRTRPASRVARFLAAKLLARPIDRAIVLFAARTLARSRQHRLLLGVYGGIGFAIAIVYAHGVFAAGSRRRWDQLNEPFLMGGLALLAFAVVGVRAVFVLPHALPANWVFRLTAVHSPAAYFRGVRKALFALGVLPIWSALAIAYFVIWPGRPALQHTLALLVAGAWFTYRLLYRFRKIPFACSYLPGKSNLNVKLGVYAIGFLFVADVGIRIEYSALQRPARFVVLLAILAAFALWNRRRTLEFAAAPENRMQFEDVPVSDIYALDLRRDGAWSSDEAYVDSIDPTLGRSLAARWRPVAFAALALPVCGAVYEQFGQWQDRRRFAHVGRRVDIGGRALNIHCAGEGAPAVLLESGNGMPGYSWVLIQREIARFTRVCWYDRAGIGWSDPGPDPNWSDSIARDLHTLLRNAAVPPPIVLVGHAMGGFTARAYRAFYPLEVAGLVLVDSAHEQAGSRIPNLPRQAPPIELPRRYALLGVRTMGRLGMVRLLRPDAGPRPAGLSPGEWDTITGLMWQSKAQLAGMQEAPLGESARFMAAAGTLGDLPLIVLTAGKGFRAPIQQAWIELQYELSQLSSRGRQVLVSHSGPMIPFEAPESVVAAVHDVVREVRSLLGGIRQEP